MFVRRLKAICRDRRTRQTVTERGDVLHKGEYRQSTTKRRADCGSEREMFDWGRGPGTQANISCSLKQSAQAFGCGLSAFPICIHSLSFCSSLAGSLPGFYPASKRLYLTFLSLVFVFDCQLTSFLND